MCIKHNEIFSCLPSASVTFCICGTLIFFIYFFLPFSEPIFLTDHFVLQSFDTVGWAL